MKKPLGKIARAFQRHRDYSRGYRKGATDARNTLQPVLHMLATENVHMHGILHSIGLDRMTPEQLEQARTVILAGSGLEG